jgi:hypothetical protein
MARGLRAGMGWETSQQKRPVKRFVTRRLSALFGLKWKDLSAPNPSLVSDWEKTV